MRSGFKSPHSQNTSCNRREPGGGRPINRRVRDFDYLYRACDDDTKSLMDILTLLRYSGAEVAAVCNEAALAALEESVDIQVGN